MKKNLFFSLSLVLVLAITFVACKKEKDQAHNGVPTTNYNPPPAYTHDGLGNYPGIPSGTAYTLPSFISVVGEIRGGISGGKAVMLDPKPGSDKPYFYYDAKETYDPYGTGTYVNLYFALANSSNSDYLLHLPAGLIFADDELQGGGGGRPQRGFLPQGININIGAGETVYVQVKSYCCNASGHPSSADDVYVFTNVSNFPGLVEIASIMANKQAPVGSEGIIQSAVWHVTDGNGLTDDDRAALNALP